ncbi:MAG: AraC family transcriptional regulator [Armatimonadota bacterium]
MADNRFFTDEMQRILLTPEDWRIVSAHHAAVAPVADPVHQRWMRHHTHDHAHREVLFVLSGSGSQGFCGQVYPSKPGIIFVFNAFEAHDLACPPWAADADHLWIVPLQDHVSAKLLRVRNGVITWPGEWSLWLPYEEVGTVAEGGLPALQATDGLPVELMRMKMTALITQMVAAVVQAGFTENEQEDRESFQQQVIESIRRYIEETAGKGTNLDGLARIAGYSKFHFLRLFQRHTGFTVHQYIDTCRMKRVREMQKSGSSQKVIADALGFSCPSAFSRWYKKQ